MVERGNGSKSTGTSVHVVDNSPTRTSFMVTPPLAPLVVSFENSGALNTPRQQKGFFSLFSRFGGKNKSLSNIITKPEAFTRPVESNRASVPNTPLTPSMKHSLSLPVFSASPTTDHSPSLSSQKLWEPIPLNNAFTQAIRMTSLSASSISMETLIRRNSERSKSPKDRRGRILHRSHASTRSVDLDWTRKTFVLIEGFLLQYSGDGPHDRSPEKTLPLTSTSIAFASDVIPGRPWVLQVYRSAGPDGGLLPERKGSFLSKIAFKGPAKNTAASLLLVFDGAEEMDAWMGSIRAEAIRLGGGAVNKPTNDVVSGIQEEEEGEEQDDPRHSRRFVIDHAASSFKNETVSDGNASKRTSTYYRSSLDAGRSFTTTVSGDHILLEHLRGSRLSLSSTHGARVPTVSPDTSPERSSTRNKRSSLALSARSRSSMELKPPSQRPLSVIDRDGNLYWIPRTPSPSAPNFSLPIPLSNGHPQLGSRRSTFSTTPPGAMPSVPTPPISTRPSLSAMSTVGTLSEISRPRTRPRQSQSNPPSPSVIASPKAKSTPVPVRPQRPVSMFDSRSSPPSEVQNLSKSPPSIKKHHLQAGIAVPPRNKSLRRKSMTAIGPPETEVAGPPLHPPPSIPLPRLPPNGSDSMHTSMPSSHYRKLPPPPNPNTPKSKSLGNRHSFHGVRREKYV
ncbi:hypothetical protein B9Z19DRAFT_1138048 [Tuber borchii]|uniref:PH domain-containing protein n=1 Tax=Tuber borchii TaxID=42251 RepID=A0A2T6ZA61_TUBBO|nr:hypothetical protein B9Z19DRAFT_1138048 [Tuber borchii]